MKITVILFILLILLIIFGNNESFDGESECAKIPRGACLSSLCGKKCKIQESPDGKDCYCIDRKEDN
jgi:hypothetical protein